MGKLITKKKNRIGVCLFCSESLLSGLGLLLKYFLGIVVLIVGIIVLIGSKAASPLALIRYVQLCTF